MEKLSLGLPDTSPYVPQQFGSCAVVGHYPIYLGCIVVYDIFSGAMYVWMLWNYMYIWMLWNFGCMDAMEFWMYGCYGVLIYGS